MWIVAKIKCSEKISFQNELKNRVDKNVVFYDPKIELHKLIRNKIRKYSKSLLENYIFCYHKKFKRKIFTNQLKNIKGLNLFLDGYNFNQKEIVDFIKRCQKFENKEGLLRTVFFKELLIQKAKFVSGPYKNMFFELIEKQKNKMKVCIGNIEITISDKKNYLYQPI